MDPSGQLAMSSHTILLATFFPKTNLILYLQIQRVIK